MAICEIRSLANWLQFLGVFLIFQTSCFAPNLKRRPGMSTKYPKVISRHSKRFLENFIKFGPEFSYTVS